ncbi:hypothetical protein [Mesonia aestuariivivens]|uniref:HEPN domain-containing protein n=1 Tax=Mesonia aestuariivivens TaxID=2796128 RepID=A0ABS6W5A9_9FLAO|nr:hypothetical protein [Mesonia aestuariivivens]MBW2963053.1 hypothetical protein [Mesonia aestuariivivens]
MKQKIIPEHQLTKLIEVIRSILEVHSIYLIGGQRFQTASVYTFDMNNSTSEKTKYCLSLIIVSHQHIAVLKEVMNELFTKMDEEVKVYLIPYTLNDLNYRLTSGDNFLSRILNTENKLYGVHDLQVTSYCSHPKMYAEIEKQWKARINRAFYFEEKVNICDTVYDETAKILILAEALRQACLALLYVFWEYKPVYYKLDYLLNLCIHFCDCPKIIFPKTSFRSHRVYHYFCHAEYLINFKSEDLISLGDSNYAHQICCLFLTEVNKEGIKKLKELKNMHFKK